MNSYGICEIELLETCEWLLNDEILLAHSLTGS